MSASIRAPFCSDDSQRNQDRRTKAEITCRIGRAESDPDVKSVHKTGQNLAIRRINADAAGLATSLEFIAEKGGLPENPPTAIETEKNLLAVVLM